jgi:hypothetical protein
MMVENWLPVSQRYSSGEYAQDPNSCWEHEGNDQWLRAPDDDEFFTGRWAAGKAYDKMEQVFTLLPEGSTAVW